jgi:kynurenine formamidase
MVSNLTYDDVEAYFQTLSNWGRWGASDELGTLNLMTDATRLAGAGLIRSGRIVACGRQISPTYSLDNPEPMLHHMITSGADATDGVHGLSDWFGIAPHGFAVTHLDALNHMAWNGKMYNGRSAAEITTRKGGATNAIENAAGFAGRGVLFDVPRTRGVDWLDIGEGIFPEDLERCEKYSGVDVGPGDILLVRTGRDARQASLGTWDFWRQGSPGLHASCLPWLRERDVAVLVSDTGQDVMPSGYSQIAVPVHAVAIVAMGLWMLDNAFLENLASECSAQQRWEFWFSVGSLRLKNATGSPVAPLAIF